MGIIAFLKGLGYFSIGATFTYIIHRVVSKKNAYQEKKEVDEMWVEIRKALVKKATGPILFGLFLGTLCFVLEAKYESACLDFQTQVEESENVGSNRYAELKERLESYESQKAVIDQIRHKRSQWLLNDMIEGHPDGTLVRPGQVLLQKVEGYKENNDVQWSEYISIYDRVGDDFLRISVRLTEHDPNYEPGTAYDLTKLPQKFESRTHIENWSEDASIVVIDSHPASWEVSWDRQIPENPMLSLLTGSTKMYFKFPPRPTVIQ